MTPDYREDRTMTTTEPPGPALACPGCGSPDVNLGCGLLCGTCAVTAAIGSDEEEPAELTAEPGGYWACIAFMGHNEHTGYVTQTVKHGQPAYHVDLPEKLWGGNPLACVEYAASAWFSERPLTEEFVRKAWEKHLRQLAERVRQEAEWQRMRGQQALTAGADDDGYGEDPF